MDPACRDALLTVTTRLLDLSHAAQAGDLKAQADVVALAALVKGNEHG